MGQQEIYQILKNSKKWLTARELAEMLGITVTSAQSNLAGLNKRNMLVSKKKRICYQGRTGEVEYDAFRCPTAYQLKENYD